MILSAKHGFLRPDDTVPGNYDVTFGTGHPEIMAADELRRQFHEKAFPTSKSLSCLAEKYRSVLNAVIGEHQHITWPLSSYKGIGYMLQALNQAVEEKDELQHVDMKKECNHSNAAIDCMRKNEAIKDFRGNKYVDHCQRQGDARSFYIKRDKGNRSRQNETPVSNCLHCKNKTFILRASKAGMLLAFISVNPK